MAYASKVKQLAFELGAIVVAASLFWFGTGLHPYWPLLWFAPLPVLWVATRTSAWRAALVAFWTMFLGILNLWNYLHDVLRTAAGVVIAECAVVALAFTLAALVFRALARRGELWAALVAFPALWVSFEYIFNLTTSAGTLISLAYSQLGFLPFLQLASITGPWGMSFLLLLFPAAIVLFLDSRRAKPRQARRVLGASATLIAAVLAFGAIRLALPVGGRLIKVGLIVHEAWTTRAGAATAHLFRAYADRATLLAERGARVVVLPEKIGVLTRSTAELTDAPLQAVANATHATLVAGVIHVAAHAQYNAARIYSPDTPVREYHKEHLLLPWEAKFTPGRKLQLLKRPSGIWGVEICKDMDFTGLSRRYGRAGVGLMLVPAWDFTVDWIKHGHAALMRGVEDGFSVVRAAKDGSLYVSDNRGRILAEVMSNSAPFATLVAEVPVAHAMTPYLLLGNWFAWLALSAALLALLRLLWLRQGGRRAGA